MAKKNYEFSIDKILINYKPKYFNAFWKRFFDILFSFICLVLISWFLIIIAILIKCTSRGPIFYAATRYTKDCKPFKCIKFRTMVLGAEDMHEDMIALDDGNSDGVRIKVKNDPRITKFGKFLRKTSIDELPQLVNVFCGSMSFVGPRPPIKSEVEKYDERDMQRMLVKGGITCIWQVSGRSNVSFKEQVEMDIKYIEKRNIFYDFWLMLRTIPAVFSHKGAE